MERRFKNFTLTSREFRRGNQSVNLVYFQSITALSGSFGSEISSSVWLELLLWLYGAKNNNILLTRESTPLSGLAFFH